MIPSNVTVLISTIGTFCFSRFSKMAYNECSVGDAVTKTRQRPYPLLRWQLGNADHIDFIRTDQDRLIGEQWTNAVEQVHLNIHTRLRDSWNSKSNFTYLLLQAIVALLRYVHNEQDSRSNMSQSGNGLHFDRIPFFQRLIQNTRRIDHLKTRIELSLRFPRTYTAYLPPKILVIHMTDVQGLRGEGVRLHFHVRSGQLVDQRRFANVWKSAKDQGPEIKRDLNFLSSSRIIFLPGVWINTWQTGQMLTDLFQIREALFLTRDDLDHPRNHQTFSFLRYFQIIRIPYRPRAALFNILHR